MPDTEKGITLLHFIEELQGYVTYAGEVEVLVRHGPQVSVTFDTPTISVYTENGKRILELS